MSATPESNPSDSPPEQSKPTASSEEKLNQAVEQLKTKIDDIDKRLRAAEVGNAKNEGVRTTATWWALGVGAMLAIFLGYNSIWAIPKGVTAEVDKKLSGEVEAEVAKAVPQEVAKTVLGKAQVEAELAAVKAQTYSERAQKDSTSISQRLNEITQETGVLGPPLGTMLPYFGIKVVE